MNAGTEKQAKLIRLEFVEFPEPMLRDAAGCVLQSRMFHRASIDEIVRRCHDYEALSAHNRELVAALLIVRRSNAWSLLNEDAQEQVIEALDRGAP